MSRKLHQELFRSPLVPLRSTCRVGSQSSNCISGSSSVRVNRWGFPSPPRHVRKLMSCHRYLGRHHGIRPSTSSPSTSHCCGLLGSWSRSASRRQFRHSKLLSQRRHLLVLAVVAASYSASCSQFIRHTCLYFSFSRRSSIFNLSAASTSARNDANSLSALSV